MYRPSSSCAGGTGPAGCDRRARASRAHPRRRARSPPHRDEGSARRSEPLHPGASADGLPPGGRKFVGARQPDLRARPTSSASASQTFDGSSQLRTATNGATSAGYRRTRSSPIANEACGPVRACHAGLSRRRHPDASKGSGSSSSVLREVLHNELAAPRGVGAGSSSRFMHCPWVDAFRRYAALMRRFPPSEADESGLQLAESVVCGCGCDGSRQGAGESRVGQSRECSPRRWQAWSRQGC